MDRNFVDEARASYHRALGVPVFKLPGESGPTGARGEPPDPNRETPRPRFATPAAPQLPPREPSSLPPKKAPPEAPRISQTISWEYPTPMVTRQDCPKLAPLHPMPDVDFTVPPPAMVGSSTPAGGEETIPLQLPEPKPATKQPKPKRTTPLPGRLDSVPISWEEEDEEDDDDNSWREQRQGGAHQVQSSSYLPAQMPSLPLPLPAVSWSSQSSSSSRPPGPRPARHSPSPEVASPAYGEGRTSSSSPLSKRKRRGFSPNPYDDDESSVMATLGKGRSASPMPRRSRSPGRGAHGAERQEPLREGRIENYQIEVNLLRDKGSLSPERLMWRDEAGRGGRRSHSPSGTGTAHHRSTGRHGGSATSPRKRPVRVKGKVTGRYLKDVHNLVFKPKEGPLFVGDKLDEAALQCLFIDIKLRTEGSAFRRTRRMSPYPSCVLVVLGAGNAAFNTTLERFQKEFGRELVEGIPDRRDDVWNSLKVRRPHKPVRGRKIILTNGFQLLEEREVRFIIGMGIPWVGYERSPRLMDQWLSFLDQNVDSFGCTSRALVQTEIWVDMSHGPQAAGIHDWFYSHLNDGGGGAMVEEELSPRFAQAAVDYKAGVASEAIPKYSVPAEALRAAKEAADRVNWQKELAKSQEGQERNSRPDKGEEIEAYSTPSKL